MSKLCRRWCEKGPRWRNVFQTGGAVEVDEQNTAAKWWDPQADGEWLMADAEVCRICWNKAGCRQDCGWELHCIPAQRRRRYIPAQGSENSVKLRATWAPAGGSRRG